VRSRLLGSYVAIAVFVLLALGVPLSLTIVRGEVDRLQSAVLADATVVAGAVEEPLEDGAPVTFDGATMEYVEESGSRIVVVDADGISVADTAAGVPRDFSTRPEVAEALAGARASGQRLSETLGTELLYVAVPVASGGDVLGAVRITYPTEAVRARILAQLGLIGVIALAVLTVATGAAVALARWASMPVAAIDTAVTRFTDGDLAARAHIETGPPEIIGLGARIDEMATRIGDLLEAQRGFVSDASHQLRTPLTGVRLELETLVEVAPEGPDAEGLERALEGVRRLDRTIDGLLTLVRLEGQRPPLRALDVPGLVAEAAETWDALAAEVGVRLAVEVDPEVAAVPAVGIPDHLLQILGVAVDNALAVAPGGSTVTLGAVVVGDRVEVHVTDAGPGMDAEARAHAFERRWQGTSPTGGAGLGLAIARRLADASGAALRLEDAPGGSSGLRVVVRLARS
jgi:signal transduction histidine kinase